ncbi:amidohydrolase family protein [Thalassoroseus pseudoceratinae]|uniref:metal-dependent hydrolase n=1 Tax=Thalassoroseus pseudoceratinae TaxID=2713176 RepID=UPI00142402D9|nr:metal-dependent hydrolase [Thalassoroseus pseudoceratinae]
MTDGTLNRRELLATSLVLGALGTMAKGTAAESQSADVPVIDTNISLFQWPFRRLPLDDTAKLVGKLRSLGISEAWASSFEGVLHRDITSVNTRLAEECQRFPELNPIGVINLNLPGWQDDVRRCFDQHHMPGVRLFPSYHGYTLADDVFVELLAMAARANRFVQIPQTLEDRRTQHPLVHVADVDLNPLASVMQMVPAARVQILNLRPRLDVVKKLEPIDRITFDTARVDSTDGVAKMLEVVPGRVALGTHAPFLIPEAALIRLAENPLEADSLLSILNRTADNLIGAAR